MNFINNKIVFSQFTMKMDSMLLAGKRLPEQVFKEGFSIFYFIEFDEIFTKLFFNKLIKFLYLENESEFIMYVTDPNPETYFLNYFNQYPIVKFSDDNTDEEYLQILLEDPGNSPADAIIYNSNTIVFFSESSEWLIYGDREMEVGVIAFSQASVASNFVTSYGKERIFDVVNAIDKLLLPIWSNSPNGMPKALDRELVSNYNNQKL